PHSRGLHRQGRDRLHAAVLPRPERAHQGAGDVVCGNEPGQRGGDRMNRRTKLAVALLVVAGATLGGVLVTRGDASRDTATLSNQGGTTIAISGLRMKLATIRAGTVLATRRDRVFYRLTTVSGEQCFGVGVATDVGTPGSVMCQRGFPSSGSPVLDLSVYEGTRHDAKEFSLFRVEGFAATESRPFSSSGRTATAPSPFRYPATSTRLRARPRGRSPATRLWTRRASGCGDRPDLAARPRRLDSLDGEDLRVRRGVARDSRVHRRTPPRRRRVDRRRGVRRLRGPLPSRRPPSAGSVDRQRRLEAHAVAPRRQAPLGGNGSRRALHRRRPLQRRRPALPTRLCRCEPHRGGAGRRARRGGC